MWPFNATQRPNSRAPRKPPTSIASPWLVKTPLGSTPRLARQRKLTQKPQTRALLAKQARLGQESPRRCGHQPSPSQRLERDLAVSDALVMQHSHHLLAIHSPTRYTLIHSYPIRCIRYQICSDRGYAERHHKHFGQYTPADQNLPRSPAVTTATIATRAWQQSNGPVR